MRIEHFKKKFSKNTRKITFEIGMLGQYGLDINDPRETHVLRALPERTFSARELLCIMYAGFKRSEPGMDIWVELGKEWGMAVAETRIILVAFRHSFDTSTLGRNYIQR
jgi:hypothetical protein